MQLWKRIAAVCDAIPAGKVASYGQIARLCGRPRAARLVGQALGRGVSDAAYRVVNSQGCLSGADAFLIPGLQRQLLEADGVEVSPEETVDLARFGWQPDQAELDAIFTKLGI